jgi:hypothetical protein
VRSPQVFRCKLRNVAGDAVLSSALSAPARGTHAFLLCSVPTPIMHPHFYDITTSSWQNPESRALEGTVQYSIQSCQRRGEKKRISTQERFCLPFRFSFLLLLPSTAIESARS